MQIGSSNSAIKDLYMKKLSPEEVKAIKQEVVDNANKYTFTDFSAENNFGKEKLSVGEQILKNTEDFQQFLYDNGIDGKSVKRVSELRFEEPSFLDIKA